MRFNFKTLVTTLLVVLALVSGQPAQAQTAANFGFNFAKDYDYVPFVSTAAVTASSTTMTLRGGPGRTTPGGKTFYPFAESTNGPVGQRVEIVDGASSEFVTITAVTCTINSLPDSCNFTATFANAHRAGVQVRSGTGGLQEAMNDLNNATGTVVVGPASRTTTTNITTHVEGTAGADITIWDTRDLQTWYTCAATCQTAGNFTANLRIDQSGITVVSSVTGASLVYEGSTADDFETTVAVTDPTADATVTIPANVNSAFVMSTLTTNSTTAANSVSGASNALVFEGATADAFETSLAPTDVGGDITLTLPGLANASGAVIATTLTTNELDVANSFWGTSNALRFEGLTADAFELILAPADVTADSTYTFSTQNGTVMVSSLSTNAIDAANSVSGVSNGVLFEGATADAFETTLSPTDVGGDITLTLPGLGNASGAVLASTLTSNDLDVANSLWAASNSLRFEGATADGFEVILSPADVGADSTYTFSAQSGTFMVSSLSTNAIDAANSVSGVSNGLLFEGATADGFETTLAPTDVGGDITLTLPGLLNASGAVVATTLTTNDLDAANAFWGASNNLRFEGATADAFETSLTPVDATVDRSISLPNLGGTVQVGFSAEVLLCGQQANNGTIYMSPVSGFATAASYGVTNSFVEGGAGCDAEDEAVEATADEVMYLNNAFQVVGLMCHVSSSGSNGVVLNLRSAAASLTPDYTTTIATTATSGAFASTPATVAAGATFGLRVINTEDLSAQDAWCIAKIVVVP